MMREELNDIERSLDAPEASPETESAAASPGRPPGFMAKVQRRALQRKADRAAADSPGDVQAAAAEGTAGTGAELPHLAQIQASFGKHDVSGVSAHTDARAASAANAMGAEAFATGDRVGFGAAPSLHTAAHEAAHVVQQRGGVQLKGGVGQEGDSHERHADAVADQVVSGRSAESMLDTAAGGATPAAAPAGGVQMKSKEEHAASVVADPTVDPTQRGKTLSADKQSEALELTYKDPADQAKLDLNDRFEHHLQENLEHGSVPIAKKMSETVGGYQTFEGAQEYIAANLDSDKEDVEHAKEPGAKTVGDEIELITLFITDDRFKAIRKPGGYVFGAPKSLEQARGNSDYLKAHKGAVDKLAPDCEGIKRLFRKIFYTVKLSEMLFSQMGYFGGSLEFKMGHEDDLEYWVYLLSTKTRNPQQQMLDPAPKPMEPYRTSEESLLPWNNQFSMSVGHAEFEDADSIPAGQRSELEQKLADFQGLGDGGIKNTAKHADAVRTLNSLVGKNPKDPETQSWTLAELIANTNENKRKTLFTDLLHVSWAREGYHWQEQGGKHQTDNPFFMQLDREKQLAPGDIKDPRILADAAARGRSPQTQLGVTEHRGHVTGKQANVLLTPESASLMFRQKLERLSEGELEKLYGEKLSVDEIVQDAKDKVGAWYKNARTNHKPIYSGPSGHTLGYLNLYKDAYQKDQKSNAPSPGKPNLEEARLVMIASLTGAKAHHSYDEVLVASQGIKTEGGEPGNSLMYKAPHSYADMVGSQTKGLSDGAAQKAKSQTEAESKGVDAKLLDEWSKKVLKP